MDAFHIYLICFGVGLLFTLASALLGHVFGADHGAEVHTDVGAGGHAESGLNAGDMPGISVFSPTTLAIFVTAFGGFGMILSRIEGTSSTWISAPCSGLLALGVAAGVLWMFNKVFSKIQGSSESRVATLVGMSATVISPIPQQGMGEIAYVQCGSRYTAPARSESGAAVPAGRTVKIRRVVGTQFFITPE